MADNSEIAWTDATWSPLRARVKDNAADIAREKGYTSLIQIGERMAGRVGQHCEHVSDGCKLCYSGTWQRRCLKVNGTGLPFDRRSRDLIDVVIDEKALGLPAKWKRPRRVFVENQSDLFGEWHTPRKIAYVWDVIRDVNRHTYQILTKRTARCVELVQFMTPLARVHLGFSAENQETFDLRWSDMKQLAAKGWMVWCSYEPALGPVDFNAALSGDARLSWIVCGGESGPGARPFHLAWARSTIAQCKSGGAMCFVKQLGKRPFDGHSHHKQIHDRTCDGNLYLKLRDRKGANPDEWPEWMRVRQFPSQVSV